MKKAITILLALLMVLTLAACNGDYGTSSQNEASTSKGTSAPKATEKKELSASEIRSATASALNNLIKDKYPTADPGSCRMDINKTEKKGDDYIVYGTVTLYDKYGKITTGYSDGSGSYKRSFEIKINGSTGTAYYGGKIK